MHGKKACLVVDLREGQDMSKIVDAITVFAAAGWKTDIALKEYGGEAMQLAAKAVEKGYDVVIAHGGDGTLNQVINGVMSVDKACVVGLIPGGTANEWAGEVGIPVEQLKAALTLVDSDVRKVDLGHVEVRGLIFPEGVPGNQQQGEEKQTSKSSEKKSRKVRQHFLLMAGLGIDAAVIEHTSKPLKYHLGRAAFDIAAMKELPEQRPFPIEVRTLTDSGHTDILWKGEAIQVIIANTRKYANLIQVAPDAYIDDGILDVCVINAGSPLKTFEQITSLLFKRKVDTDASRYFRGAHFSIRVPAAIRMQVDGSAVDLKDYLGKADMEALEQVQDPYQVMVDYYFDAEPHVLRVAIPSSYDNALFEKSWPHDKRNQLIDHEKKQASKNELRRKGHSLGEIEGPRTVQNKDAIAELMERGTKVSVIGVVPHPEKEQTFIIGGTTQKKDNDETEPIAIRVNEETIVINSQDEYLSVSDVSTLEEGAVVVADGKKNKRGVLKATQLLI